MCHLHFWTSMTCKDVPFSIEFNQRVVDVPLLGQLLESRGDYYHDNLLVYFSERGLLVWNIFGIFDALLSSDVFNLWIYCTTILEILKDLESCLSFNSIMMYHSNWCTSKCFRTAHDIYTHLFIYIQVFTKLGLPISMPHHSAYSAELARLMGSLITVANRFLRLNATW